MVMEFVGETNTHTEFDLQELDKVKYRVNYLIYFRIASIIKDVSKSTELNYNKNTGLLFPPLLAGSNDL